MLLFAYAMLCTDLGYGHPPEVRLRVWYALSGTELAHGVMSLRICYALCGTELAYAATSGWMTVYNFPSTP
eukprot:3940481-Rhodomonas_salina.8